MEETPSDDRTPLAARKRRAVEGAFDADFFDAQEDDEEESAADEDLDDEEDDEGNSLWDEAEHYEGLDGDSAAAA